MRTSPGNGRREAVERLTTRPARESVLQPTSTLGVGRDCGRLCFSLFLKNSTFAGCVCRGPFRHPSIPQVCRTATPSAAQTSCATWPERPAQHHWNDAKLQRTASILAEGRKVRGQGRKPACRTVPASPTVTKPVADPFIPIELQMPIQAPAYHHSPLHSARHSALRQFRCSQSLPRTVSGL
jgi:hypothetical protein